jgi:hypothetical protein
MPDRGALSVGRLTGILDAHAWRIDSSPLGEAAPSGGTYWAPLRIALSVRSPSGATVEVDMVRLRKLTTK